MNKLDPEFGRIDLQPIAQVLGHENMPDLPPGPVGRFRLIHALSTRFGQSFKMMQGPRKALEHFDSETKHVRKFLEMREQYHGKRE